MTNKRMLHRFIRSRPHLSVSIGIGVMVGLVMPESVRWITRALVGWNVAVWLYLVAMMWVTVRADHHRVRNIAGRQDESAGLVLFSLTIAAVLSITAIVLELGQIPQLSPEARVLHYGFTALTVLGSWFLVGFLFCFHYAHLFYRSAHSALPLSFPNDLTEPDYWDFLYFSFTIAVAAQTSDVTVADRTMRKLVVGQSILSFFFNVAILGLSINIAAGMLNR